MRKVFDVIGDVCGLLFWIAILGFAILGLLAREFFGTNGVFTRKGD